MQSESYPPDAVSECVWIRWNCLPRSRTEWLMPI